ncbi:Uncharacterised protein [Mycobacteroides abscessus subsp. abscessus]|nr:Uncharacterised protein [Mycobacteroides abscessus subsp. abscessus]
MASATSLRVAPAASATARKRAMSYCCVANRRLRPMRPLKMVCGACPGPTSGLLLLTAVTASLANAAGRSMTVDNSEVIDRSSPPMSGMRPLSFSSFLRSRFGTGFRKNNGVSVSDGSVDIDRISVFIAV